VVPVIPVKLLLFDIDGTLVLTGGAGLRGMTRAFERTFGLRDALNGVTVMGRTDPAIYAEVLARESIAGQPGDHDRFQAIYLAALAEEMHVEPGEALHPSQHSAHKGPLPGVPALVARLANRDDVFLALLSGYYSRAAEIKLGHFDLWQPFRCGAFGEDAGRRHELVPVAVSRARASGCPPVSPDEVIVIGDTPLDVACARDAGVRCLAVATGGYDVDTLFAAGAEHAVPTLEDVDGVTAWLLAGA
jgi:phosphoglycolate phosphatase-like HAD superfamily hydrolase